mgnify:CR=1 FL=1
MHKYHRYEFNKNKCPMIMYFASGLFVSLAYILAIYFRDKMPYNLHLEKLYGYCMDPNQADFPISFTEYHIFMVLHYLLKLENLLLAISILYFKLNEDIL